TATIDLSSVGSIDWVQWPEGVRKTSGGGKISDFAAVGNGSNRTYIGDARTLKWNDGTPMPTGSSTNAIMVSATGSGFQITVPADTTMRMLSVYVGAQNASGKLTAHLSDGSATDYAHTLSAQKKRTDGTYTLTY